MSMLIYGEAKSGKTSLWSTFPGRILCLVCSGGKQPGELKPLAKNKAMREKIDAPIINHSDALVDRIDRLAKGEGDYKTVVLDHGSGLLSLLLKEHLGLTDIPQVKSWGMTDRKNWGVINEKCIEILRAFLSLPMDRIIIAQERVNEPRTTGSITDFCSDALKVKCGPAFSPQVAEWLKPVVDYGLHTFVRPKMIETTEDIGGNITMTLERSKVPGDKMEFCARTEKHDYYWTGFRVDKSFYLPDAIVDPTYDKLMQVINGKYPRPKTK